MPPCHQAIGVISDGVTSSVCIVVLLPPVTVITTSFITLCWTHLFFFFLFPACIFMYCCLQLNKFNNNRFFFFFIILINCDVFVLIPALFTFFSSILRLLLLLVTLDAFGICTKKSFPLEGACHSCKFLWFEECVLPRQCLSNQPPSF